MLDQPAPLEMFDNEFIHDEAGSGPCSVLVCRLCGHRSKRMPLLTAAYALAGMIPYECDGCAGDL